MIPKEIKYNLHYDDVRVSHRAAYKRLVRPILEYDSCVWDFQGMVLQEENKKKVRNSAARFITSNYCSGTRSMTGILGKFSLSRKEGGTVDLFSCTKV